MTGVGYPDVLQVNCTVSPTSDTLMTEPWADKPLIFGSSKSEKKNWIMLTLYF